MQIVQKWYWREKQGPPNYVAHVALKLYGVRFSPNLCSDLPSNVLIASLLRWLIDSELVRYRADARTVDNISTLYPTGSCYCRRFGTFWVWMSLYLPSSVNEMMLANRIFIETTGHLSRCALHDCTINIAADVFCVVCQISGDLFLFTLTPGSILAGVEQWMNTPQTCSWWSQIRYHRNSKYVSSCFQHSAGFC